MPRKDLELTRKVRERIKKWDDDWRFNKDQYHEFTSFVMGSQWTEDESKLFIDYKKIPLSMNKLAPLMNHLIGEQKMRTTNLEVTPNDNVPVMTAQVRSALVKDICLNSDSKRVGSRSFAQAGIGGFGAFLLDTEFESDHSFDQIIVFRETKDPTYCYWDVSAMHPCKIDGMSAGERYRMSRKMFSGVYGEEIEKQIGSDANYDEGSATGWIFSNDKEITVIRDYERVYDTETLYQLSNGRIVTAKEKNKMEKLEVEGKKFLVDDGEIVTVANQRDVPKYKIMHRKIAGDFVLEEVEFPSEDLPILFVDQDSYYDKSGKQICRPFIKDARDAQRYINYLATQSAYLMRVSRYDQFLVSKANVKSPDTQLIWRDPATAQGGLVYDESPNGNKPEQLRPPELSQSLITQYQRALSDIESCTGIYGTQIGEQGNETSGKAIDARAIRGSKNTFIPFDSIDRAYATAGKVIDQMIPRVYDSQRELSLNMPDRGNTKVMINKQMDQYGSQIENDMTAGHYTIRLMPGPSFEGQKQENLESIQTVLQADPTLFRMVADLYVENLPLANNIELRNRLRTLVPPEIIQAGKTGEPIPPKPEGPPPEVMLKMQELQMKKEQFEQSMQMKMKDIEIKEHQLQLEGIKTGQDITVQMQKLETEKMLAAAQLQEQELRYSSEMQRVSADLQMKHGDNMIKLLTHHPKFEHKEQAI